MSLINKMLQDLDARGNPRPSRIQPEIQPVARPQGRLPPRIAAITAALLVAAAGASAWLLLPSRDGTGDKPSPAIRAPATPAATAQAAPEQAPELAPVNAVDVAAAPAAGGDKVYLAAADEERPARAPAVPASAPVEKPLTAIKPPPTAGRQSAPAAVPAPVPPPAPVPAAAPIVSRAASEGANTSWAVASERARVEEERLVQRWRAENRRIAGLPPGERVSAQTRLREEQIGAASRLKANAAWVAALKRKEDAASTPSGDGQGTGAAAVPAKGSRTQGRVETTSQGAENSYRRALTALQEGRIGEAITGLQATLRAHPAHEAARQTLVSLLIESNRGDEAVLQLQQALALDARQPALAMLLARLQIERGKSGIDTLLRTLPYAAGNADYHAFLAGALARQARHGEAVEQYQAALRSVPANAVWWMGLGISLQADKRNSEALDAFRQAKALGTLSGELQAFVERRIAQLAR